MSSSVTSGASQHKYSIPLLLLLIAAGLAGNYFKFPIFLNIDFLFGSIFALLALQFFGLGRGILAAVAIASYTYILWNHPYAIIIMTAEVAVVGWLMGRPKMGLVLADTLYWLAMGMPLVYLFYHVAMDVPSSNTHIVMTKQAVNGIANALVARLIFTGYALRSRTTMTSYSEIIYNLLAAFVLLPTLVILAIGSRSEFTETDQHIRASLLQESQHVAHRLETWIKNRELVVSNLAAMAETNTPQHMQVHMQQAAQSDSNFLRIGLLNKEATSTAYFPLVDDQGQSTIGKNFADRPYIPQLRQTLKPMLSEIVMSRIGAREPIVMVLAPVVNAGKYDGYISGIISLDQLRKELDSSMGEGAVLYTLLDKHNKVVLTNRTDQKVMTPFAHGDGEINHLGAGINQWVPSLVSNKPASERWKNSFYFAEVSVAGQSGWQLLLEQPVAPFQNRLYANYADKLGLLFVILLVALALAELLSRRTVSTLEKLGTLTNILPSSLMTADQNIVWPQSGFKEAHHLINNFKAMSNSLTAQFAEIRQINQSLEQRVADRTAKLAESEFLWKFAIEGSGFGVWDVNIQTGEANYSKRWKEMLGYAENDIPPTHEEWLKRIHPDDQASVAAAGQAYLDGKTPIYVAEYRLKCKDGSYKWILARGMVVAHSEDEKPLRMIGTHTDVTQRKEMEQARAEALNRLQKIAGRIPGVVFQFRLRADGSSCLPYVSEALRDIYRVSPEDVRDDASPVFAVVHPDDLQQHIASIEASARNLTPWNNEYRLKFEGEPDIWLLGNAIPQQEENGSVLWHGIVTDITARKEAEETIRISEQRFRDMSDAAGAYLWEIDSDMVYTFVSGPSLDVKGYLPEELLGHTPLEFMHKDDIQPTGDIVNHAIASKSPFILQHRDITKSGEVLWEEVHGASFYDDSGNVIGMRGTGISINARKAAEEKLQLAASVFSHSREGIMITEPDGTIIDVNDAFTRITGYSREEVMGQNPRILSSGRQGKDYYTAMWHGLIDKGHWYGEIWNRRKSGEVYAEMQTISTVHDEHGTPKRYVSLFSDITSQKQHQNQLEHIAHYDALTSLPNRVLLADRLHQGMAQALRRDQLLAVVYLDLDGFKAINDNHGHEVGDQLLISVSNRMKQALREGDTLARLGGDEFVAVLLDLENTADSVPMLSRLLAAAAQPVHIEDLVLQISSSLGITFYPQMDDVDADQLLRQADQAMYQAKLAGKNRYHVFDAEHDRSVRGHHESLEDIRRALSEREFVLHYQPKVNMRKGTVIGAEALIRWQHRERGLLLPGEFLPTIEDHPLAVELGEWVIETALSHMELWHAAGLEIPVSVNVGARQLQQADFVDRLRALLENHPKASPGSLEIEVLETSALEDMTKIYQVIEACRAIGVSFALDDFGTGYSSLTYLKHLPVAQLKIDQSFVRDMLDDPEDMAILEGVIGLASAFRREVIAEGVETVKHGEMLLHLGCELAQGYGIARPMPAHDLPNWSAGWHTDASWANLPAVSRDDLPLLFASADHRAWVAAMHSHLMGERETAPQMDHHHCRFGIWLESEGRARYGARAAFQTIDTLHRLVHSMAQELLELHARGQHADVQKRLPELQSLRDVLVDQLMSLVREIRQ